MESPANLLEIIMSSINLTITVTAAQAAAAGIDTHGDISVSVQPSALSEGARHVLAALLRRQGGDRYTHNPATLPPPAAPDAENVRAWLESCAAEITARQAASAAAAARELARNIQDVRVWAARPDDEIMECRAIGNHPATWSVRSPYDPPAEMADVIRERIAAAGPRLAERNAELEATRAATTAAAALREAEQRAADQRRDAQIAAWLSDEAPDAMRKRAARGLLPEADIVAAMRDAAYAPLADLPRFVRLTEADVRRELDADDYAEIEFATRGAESAHDEDIALMERIEAALPGCTCELIEHVGYLDGAAGADDPEMVRYSVRVSLTVGELQFTREYATRAN